MKDAYEVARHLAGVFADDGIPYAIGGALALGVWGVPRATKDVDVSVLVTRAELPRVLDSLERAGVMVKRDDAAREVDRIGMFVGRYGVFRVDVFLSEHPQYVEMAKRVRRVQEPDGFSLAFISPEDLCLYKLMFGRHKDLGDLEALLAVRPLDLAYVRSWLTQMVPQGDRRLEILDDLERRFGAA